MDDLIFRTIIKKAQIYHSQKYFGYPDTASFDIDFERTDIEIDFSLTINSRSFGLDSIWVNIKKVSCEVNWYVDGTDELAPEEIAFLVNTCGGTEINNGRIEGNFTIDSTKVFKGKEWEIISEVEFKKDGALTIDEVEIDLDNMKIEIK